MMDWVILFVLTTAVMVGVGTATKEGINDCDGVNIVSRQVWRARNPLRVKKLHLPVNHIVIAHTDTPFCVSEHQCSRWVRSIQDYHLDEKGWWDISYNFFVGGDGNIYEARGWFYTGSYAANYNYMALGLSFIGDFNKDKPTDSMLNATLNLIKCGVKKGYITPTREIHGHRDVLCTDSPGDNLYKVIRSWDNFKGGYLPDYHCKHL